jgi:hypothetical protein
LLLSTVQQHGDAATFLAHQRVPGGKGNSLSRTWKFLNRLHFENQMGDFLKILVVDAFRSNDSGRKRAKAFLRLVRDALRTVSMDTNFTVDIRGSDELTELVFDRTQSEPENHEVITVFYSETLWPRHRRH